MSIHPTAIVHPGARIADDVAIGPWCLVEDGVSVGAGSMLGPFSRVLAGSALGENVILDGGAVIGGVPQDQKYGGEPSRVSIGSGTRVGEYATVNRAAVPNGVTKVGENCLIMAYAHVAHDCELADGAILANAVQLGGHVRIGAGAIVSGMTGVHQFTAIGTGAFIGGGLRVDQDVPPFCRALGEPLRWGGLNLTGLRRGGTDEAALVFLESFYRRLYGESEAAALAWVAGTGGDSSAVGAVLLAFFADRKRALLRRGRASG
jgi:UDP-N-acetylglucosamine acyltransferase